MAFLASELRKASRGHVVAALGKVRNRAPDQWLPAGHVAVNGGLKANWAVLRTLPPQDLIDAVAISIPTHCVDGWTFAARSMNSLLVGDPHTCRHMAYYAQLRAALCILANMGVGLFNGKNFAIDSSGNIVRIDPLPPNKQNKKGIGTHQIVWTALKEWGQDPQLANAFLDLMTFKHTSLRDILETLWPGFISVTTVGTLISAWGIDLQRGKLDHDDRNNSSYSPHSLNPIAMSTSENLDFVGLAWPLFEPSGISGFDNLDRHLLRRMLIAQHNMSEPDTAVQNGIFLSRYTSLPEPVLSFCPQSFVLSQQTQPLLLDNANANAIPSEPLHMLSRALLLLRIATAFTRSSLTEAGVAMSAGELTAWLDEIAVSRGFCASGASIGNGSGLWDEIDFALADMDASRQPPPADLLGWKSKEPNGMPLVSEFERIALWGLCA